MISSAVPKKFLELAKRQDVSVLRCRIMGSLVTWAARSGRPIEVKGHFEPYVR